MLKLEKIAKTLEISISLRPQAPFFTRHFIEAFSIALGLHLLAGFLFTIQRGNTSDNLTVLSPVYVESEAFLNNQVVADFKAEDVVHRYMQEPMESWPEYPSFSSIPVGINAQPFRKPKKETGNPFIKSERWLATPTIPLPTLPEKQWKPLQISVSGGLENYPLLNEGWRNADLAFLKNLPLNECKASYEIRLDLQTGSIFWYQPLYSCKSGKYRRFAEQILNRMIFHVSDPSKAVVSGTVEICFFRGKENYD